MRHVMNRFSSWPLFVALTLMETAPQAANATAPATRTFRTSTGSVVRVEQLAAAASEYRLSIDGRQIWPARGRPRLDFGGVFLGAAYREIRLRWRTYAFVTLEDDTSANYTTFSRTVFVVDLLGKACRLVYRESETDQHGGTDLLIGAARLEPTGHDRFQLPYLSLPIRDCVIRDESDSVPFAFGLREYRVRADGSFVQIGHGRFDLVPVGARRLSFRGANGWRSVARRAAATLDPDQRAVAWEALVGYQQELVNPLRACGPVGPSVLRRPLREVVDYLVWALR